MDFSPQNLRLSSPSPSKQQIFKDPNTIDQDYLYNRLNAILFTLQAQKQQFQQRMVSQKLILQQKAALQQERINQLSDKNQKLQQQCRQLRFNYHQRGSVVDYLKKKVTVIQKKFDSEKEEMLSVIKYLESRNSQLNEIIFELKKKQLQLNQNLFSLQEKYFNLSNQVCMKSINQSQLLKINTKRQTQRVSLCHKRSGAQLTPLSITQKYRNQKILSSSRQNNFHINSNTMEDSNIESLADSSIREKTVKFQNTIHRAKSQEDIDFAQLNHIISLGGSKPSKSTDVHQISGKGILINNYGHLSFNDYQGEYRPTESSRPTGLKKQNYVSRPKMSLPNHGRYVAQLNTKRTNKEAASSRQF